MIHKHFKTKAKFNQELSKNPSTISEDDICFIKDTGEIWTHGKFYAQTDSVLESLGVTVKYTSQSLTEEQKTQARSNIGAGTSNLVIGTSTGTAADGKIVSDHIGDTSNPHGVTKTQVGLGNVTNDAQVKRSEMGVANGVATLTEDGKVPTEQLYDTLEGYEITNAYTKNEIDLQEEVVALALNEFEIQSETIAAALVDLEENGSPEEEVTWEELVNLRDNGRLNPGKEYKIIDYSTIVGSGTSGRRSSTRSAGGGSGFTGGTLYITDRVNKETYYEPDYAEYFKYSGTMVFDGETYYKWDKYIYGSEPGVDDGELTEGDLGYSISILTDTLYQPGDLGIENSVYPKYYLKDDEEYENSNNGRADKFVEVVMMGSTPALYKTAQESRYFGGYDEKDEYRYSGTFEFDGETYYKWDKYETPDGSNVPELTQYSILTDTLYQPGDLGYDKKLVLPNYLLRDDDVYGDDGEVNWGDSMLVKCDENGSGTLCLYKERIFEIGYAAKPDYKKPCVFSEMMEFDGETYYKWNVYNEDVLTDYSILTSESYYGQEVSVLKHKPIDYYLFEDSDMYQDLAGLEKRIVAKDLINDIDPTGEGGPGSERNDYDIIVKASTQNSLSEIARASRRPGLELPSNITIPESTKTIYLTHCYSEDEDVYLPFAKVPDMSQPFTYSGTFEFDDEIYHKWDGENNCSVLTKTNLINSGVSVDNPISFDYYLYDDYKYQGTDTNSSPSGIIKKIVKLDYFPERTLKKTWNPESWEIKYCLDNDKTRFGWASNNGKGVVYYLKDEFGNTGSFDFKNITFDGKFAFSLIKSGKYYDATSWGQNLKVGSSFPGVRDNVVKIYNNINFNAVEVNINDFTGISNKCIDPRKFTISYPEVTWEELKSLRDEKQLISGQRYRITDYQTICSGENVLTGEHQFDIIVEAIESGVLSESAKVTWSKSDYYFNNSNLGIWEIKYCLDNDTSRFDWASEDGKGVIYRMTDEFGNTAGYDFKNIMFLDSEVDDYLYTFSLLQNNKILDASIVTTCSVYNNIIGDGYEKSLGGNVFYAGDVIKMSVHDNNIGPGCSNIRIGNDCYNNIIGPRCSGIKLPDKCKDIVVETCNTNISLTTIDTSSGYIQNITISSGTNTSDTLKTISHPTRDDQDRTIYINSRTTTVEV